MATIKDGFNKLKSKIGLGGVVVLALMLSMGTVFAAYFLYLDLGTAEFSVDADMPLVQTTSFVFQDVDTTSGPVVQGTTADFDVAVTALYRFDTLEDMTLTADPLDCDNDGMADCIVRVKIDEAQVYHSSKYPANSETGTLTAGPHTVEAYIDCVQYTCAQTRTMNVVISEV